jgi:IMP dehydrogenase
MSSITFSDIYIEAQYSEVLSRSQVSTMTRLGHPKKPNIELELPVISANMPNITEWKMAVEMAKNGGLGILHRFQNVDSNIKDYLRASTGTVDGVGEKNLQVGVSIGIKDEERRRFDALYEAGARLFCIDLAHGHTKMMKEMIQYINSVCGKDIPIIIAGNIASGDAAVDLVEWGATVVKVGIGPGKVCRTRSNTGVGKPQFSALMEVSRALIGSSCRGIIADGGIKTTGDIAKALIYADAVMVGAVLAGTSETPGNVYPEPGTDLTNRTYYKIYGGSASMENKVANGQKPRFVEGEMLKVPFKGHAKHLLREIKDGLQSAFSLSGASSLKEYQLTVKWSSMSGEGARESKL